MLRAASIFRLYSGCPCEEPIDQSYSISLVAGFFLLFLAIQYVIPSRLDKKIYMKELTRGFRGLVAGSRHQQNTHTFEATLFTNFGHSFEAASFTRTEQRHITSSQRRAALSFQVLKQSLLPYIYIYIYTHILALPS